MKKHIFDKKTGRFIRVEDCQPACKDYCDACGDCLACYGEDLCYGIDPPGQHYWVEYVNEDDL